MREWLSTTNHTPEFACRSQLKWERTIIGYVNYTWTRWRNPTNNVNQCWAIKNKKNECYSYGDGCLMFMIGLLRCNFTYVCPVRSPMYCVCVCVCGGYYRIMWSHLILTKSTEMEFVQNGTLALKLWIAQLNAIFLYWPDGITAFHALQNGI